MSEKLQSENDPSIAKELEKASILRKIWLAGVGAFATTGEESSKIFNTLVDKGQQLETQFTATPAKPSSRTKEEDFNILVPNFIETAIFLWLDAMRKHDNSLIDGSLDSARLLVDLLMAACSMPTNIQVLFVQLVQTAHRVLEVSEQQKPIKCAEAEQKPADPEKLKNLIRNHLALTERGLSLGDDCPADLSENEWDKLSYSLRRKLTERFSEEAIGVLDTVISEGKNLYENHKNDPVFVKDAFVFSEIVKCYSKETPELIEFAYYDDPLFLLRTIIGLPTSWFVQKRYSEFKTLCADPNESTTQWKLDTDGREETEKNRYVKDVWLGTRSLDIVFLKKWQEEAWKRPNNSKEKIPEHEIGKDEEIWFYVNGITTDHYIAQLNAEYLAKIFRRRIYILHNETEGFYRDIKECIRGRVENEYTRAMVDVTAGLVLKTKEAIFDKANGDDNLPKVVIIAHSQGTIITANVVKALRDPRITKSILQKILLRHNVPEKHKNDIDALLLRENDVLATQLDNLLKKLEVFNFANCSDEFVQKEIPSNSQQYYPAVVEHFVNQHDLVGALAPQDRYGFAGVVFERKGAWGHLLNTHYLDGFLEGAYQAQGEPRESQLVKYQKDA